MKQDRSTKILELLTQEHRLEVSRLSEVLGVSAVTIRKDLDALERRGIITRQRGFAVLKSMEDVNGRLAYHYEAKQRIAKKAASLVSDGETIMVENGSCCCLLAEALVEAQREVTIITNSAFIAEYIRQSAGARVILLGGSYQNDSQVNVGPLLKLCAEQFLVNKLFIGADGFSQQVGFTNADLARAAAVRDMAAQAQQVIVLTESEKFLSTGVVPINLQLGSEVRCVVTDDRIAPETSSYLESKGAQVLQVSAAGEQ